MDDLISRQTAIDALKKSMPSLTTPDGSGTFDHDIYVAQETIVDDIRIIKDLPSVQPETQWHEFRQEQNPKTGLWEWVEPLPKDRQRILVTVCVEGHEPVQEDYWYEDGSGCWLDSGYDIGTEAIAWRPMLEPYKKD